MALCPSCPLATMGDAGRTTRTAHHARDRRVRILDDPEAPDCRAVETAVPWVPDPEAPKEAVGAVLLIEERTSDGKEFWLSQIIGHRWCKARAGESERRSRWSFRIVDPRVIARLGINDEADDDRKAELIEQLDWHPVDEPDLLRSAPW